MTMSIVRSAEQNLVRTSAWTQVMVDLVRFGVLTHDQIARRLGQHLSPPLNAQLSEPLNALIACDYVREWPPVIQGTRVFSATARGVRLAGESRAARHAPPPLQHLRHDIAVVDLADTLLAESPSAVWIAERDIGSFLRAGRARGGPPLAGSLHRPDGVLVADGARIAIELEHTEKAEARYAAIFRWFALTSGVDAVRWYVDDERIIPRLRRVGTQYGFAEDVDFSYAPFPMGVVMRPWVQP